MKDGGDQIGKPAMVDTSNTNVAIVPKMPSKPTTRVAIRRAIREQHVKQPAAIEPLT
jgi:hypothetical protein